MGHAHTGTGPGPASPRVRRLLALALVPCLLATLVGLVLLWPDEAPTRREGLGVSSETVQGTVVGTEPVACAGVAEPDGPDEEAASPASGCLEALIRLTSGPDRNLVTLQVTREAPIEVVAGTRLVLGVEPSAPPELRYHILDVQRGRPLLWLGLLFALAVVGLGRWRGLAALAGLAVTLVVLVEFVLPALLAGASPLPIAVVGSAAIMFVAVYLAHGVSARTSVAVLGTLISLVLTGLLAALFVAAGDFTGLASEEASFLRAVYGQVDVHGLLLAGIIIGSLGVLDDVTVTQASAVWELRAANPLAGARVLYRSALRIGRDHIASTVNTLVLAYAGASLPLLLLFTVSGRGVGEVLTSEVVAQEVVRTLVGSIGLVASVPITTALAAFVAVRGEPGRSASTVPAVDPDDGTEWLADVRATWRAAEREERARDGAPRRSEPPADAQT